jgi:hypothetical protein
MASKRSTDAKFPRPMAARCIPLCTKEQGSGYRRNISHQDPNDRLALNGDGGSVGSIVVRYSIIVRYGQEATGICHNRNDPKLESQSQQIPNPKIPRQYPKPHKPQPNSPS